MGCDIHFVVEHKGPEDDEWMGVYSTDLTPRMRVEGEPAGNPDGLASWHRSPVFKVRNYDFFGRLAGVRRESGQHPLGLPGDISARSRRCVDRWDTDGHSHSYATLRDFALKYAQSKDAAVVKTVVVATLQDDEATLKTLLEDLLGDYHDWQDYRVVYWFDN